MFFACLTMFMTTMTVTPHRTNPLTWNLISAQHVIHLAENRDKNGTTQDRPTEVDSQPLAAYAVANADRQPLQMLGFCMFGCNPGERSLMQMRNGAK